MLRSRNWSNRLAKFFLAVVTVTLAPAASVAVAADAPARGFVDKVYKDDTGEHKYVVFVPRNYSPEKQWPLILFLHGAGERGNDGIAPLSVGLGPYVKAHADTFPFLVVFPQCEDTKGPILQCWSPTSPDGKRALEIVGRMSNEYRVDPKRQILTGWSMGGYGAWAIAATNPGRWSAVVTMSGGGDPESAVKLKDVPVWVVHGADDKIVPPEESRKMVEALRAAGGNVRYDEVANIGHDAWQVAYGNDALYQWMLNPTAATASRVALRVRPGERPALEPDASQPFVPALEIPGAVYTRLGNEMLEAVSVAIPGMVPPDLLRGRIDDMQDYTTAEGRGFNITFTGITYSGKVTRAAVEAYRKDRLNVQLGLENVGITIGTTYVSGENHSAVAGPISVVIGHQRPVWLSIDVTPYVENRQLKLKLVASRFDIPSDNWYVTSPAGISTQGFGMTREKVSSGLVRGLYGSKGRIEREVVAIVPSLVAEVEKKLDVHQASEMVQSFWPLPVYRPRVRVWPMDVSTDAEGVSLLMGVTVAAIHTSQPPGAPPRITPIGKLAGKVPESKHLQLGIAPEILGPLTKLLIDADAARIHVQDIPGTSFDPLVDAKSLGEIIPDLKAYGDDVEIWCELVLAEPMAVNNVEGEGNEGGDHKTLEFEIPRVLISMAIKTDPSEREWTPYAEFDVRIAQQAQTMLVASQTRTPALKLAWSGTPKIEVSGRFAPGYSPKNSQLNVQEIQRILQQGWKGWTQSGPLSQTTIPDVTFGLARLRLSEFDWSPPYLNIGFGVPAVRIFNSSNAPLVYEVKGPTSGWGGPYTLEAGKKHEYQAAYPLTYRRRAEGRSVMYTLDAGTSFEFRAPQEGGPPQLFQAREETFSPPEPGDEKSGDPQEANNSRQKSEAKSR